MTSRLAYEMSTAIIAGAAAHRLRQLGAAEVKVTVTLTPDMRRCTLIANVADDDAAEADQLIRGLDPGAVYVGLG